MSIRNTTPNITAYGDAVLNQGSGNAVGGVAHDLVVGNKYGKKLNLSTMPRTFGGHTLDLKFFGYALTEYNIINQARQPAKSLFYGVPAENRAFVDRPNILANMEAALSGESSSGCKILALNGLGGMGKTQLMLRYCYLHQAAYNYVFWLEVDSWSATVEGFRKLAIKLGIDKESAKGEDLEVIDWVHSWFHEKTNWLLLLNNADNDEMDKKLFKLLPRRGGNIILTTRMHIPPAKAAVIHVNKMQEHEAIILLYGVSSIDLINQTNIKFDCAQEIITELDYMPLAVDLARAYVKDTGTSFKEYQCMLKDKKKHIKLFNHSDEEDPDRYKHTMATVWQLSFERIRALNPTAVQLLDAFTFFRPENIPACIFQQQYSALNLDSYEAIRKAIVLLARFSFVTHTTKEDDPSSDLLTIHRLVQKVVYNLMDDARRLSWAHKIAAALNDEIDWNSCECYTTNTQKTMNIYLPHIRHFVTLLCDLSQQPLRSRGLDNVLTKVTQYLEDCGMYFDAEQFAQLSLQISEAVYGPEHPDTATSMGYLAGLYVRQGKYDEAKPLQQQELVVKEKALGPEHPETATALGNLAIIYGMQGKYDEAEPLHQRALAIHEKVLGPEHRFTATRLNNLAGLYVNRGEYDKAEPLYRRALAINKKVLGPEHPSTSRKLGNLAGLYVHQGKYDEAEPLYQRALAINEKVLGPEHHFTATTLDNLAMLYKNQGKYDEAEPLYQRALAISEKVLGPEHPEIATTLNNLAGLYKSQGKHDEAEPLYQRALAIDEKVLGPEHSFTATILNNLAGLYRSQGKYDRAEPLYQRALAISEKVLGPEHPEIATTLNNLAGLYESQGKHDEAEPLYQRALGIREKVLGPKHPRTVGSLNRLAELYKSQHNYDEAEMLYKRAAAIREKALGPDITKSLNDLLYKRAKKD